MSYARVLATVALILALIGVLGILVGYTTGVYSLWYLQFASLAALLLGVLSVFLQGWGMPTTWQARAAIGGSVLTLLMGFMLPALAQASKAATRVACAANLQSIGAACRSYAKTNGEFPPDLTTLVELGLLKEQQIRCPSAVDSGAGRDGSYVYIAGQTPQMGAQNVLACDQPDNHTGQDQDGSRTTLGGNVLFVDGRVRFTSPYTRVQALITATRNDEALLARNVSSHIAGLLTSPSERDGAPQADQERDRSEDATPVREHVGALAQLSSRKEGARALAEAVGRLDSAARSAVLVVLVADQTIRRALLRHDTPALWESVEELLVSSSVERKRAALLCLADAGGSSRRSICGPVVAKLGTDWLVEACQSPDGESRRCGAEVVSHVVDFGRRGNNTTAWNRIMSEATGSSRETLLPLLAQMTHLRLPVDLTRELAGCLADESDSVRRSATLLLSRTPLGEEQAAWLADAEPAVEKAIIAAAQDTDPRLRASGKRLVRVLIEEEASSPEGLLSCLRSSQEPVREAALRYIADHRDRIVASSIEYISVFEGLMECTMVEDEELRTLAWYRLAYCKGALDSPAVLHAVASSRALGEAGEVPARAAGSAEEFLRELVGLAHHDRLDALSALLANPNVRCNALRALGSVCSQSRNPRMARDAAAPKLGAQARMAVASVVAVLWKGNDRERRAAVDALAECADFVGSVMLLDVLGDDGCVSLMRLANAGDEDEQGAAKVVLRRLFYIDDAQCERLAYFLNSSNESVRHATLQYIGNSLGYCRHNVIADPPAHIALIRALLECARDPNPDIFRESLRLLYKCEAVFENEEVAQVLNDSEAKTRIIATCDEKIELWLRTYACTISCYFEE